MKQLIVRLDDKLYERLRKVAYKRVCYRSEIIRAALEEYLFKDRYLPKDWGEVK